VSSLRIAPGLTLDADYVGGGTFALLAKKGAGKTYTGRVICEEFWKAKVPFVALDPMDAWWGLRSSADGEGEGIPVAIFGGPHGDAPLERTGGKLMADLVVDEGLSMVLCLKDLGSRAAERQFALDFLERLYRRNSELVHLLIDEADLFAPQKPQSGDQPLLGVTENIVRRGRNSGIGITLITQRPAVLNKDVLTQVDGLCVMRITGYNDREAIDDWVKGHADQELAREVKPTLAGLANGECWWWVPELDVLKRVQVRQAKTFDSSPTRKRGGKQREPKSFADVNMDAIATKMTDTIERAKADDPKELRRQLAELRKQLAARPTEVETHVETVTETVEVPVVSEQHAQLLAELVKTMREVQAATAATVDQLAASLANVNGASPAARAGRTERVRAAAPAAARAPARRPAQAAPRVVKAVEGIPPYAIGDDEVKLGKGERTVLDVLADYPEGRTYNELAFLAGYSAKASTLGVILSNLRKAGLVEPGNQPVRPTAEGLALAGGPRERPTGQALLDQWLRHPRMGEGERRVLLELIELYPDEPTHEELCERTGYSPSASTMGVILSKLRKLGLVEKGARRIASEFMEAIEGAVLA
jgi:hypothetical protein